MQDFQKKKSDDVDVEKFRVIKAAAEIIKNDIKQMSSDMTVSPTVEEIENSVKLSFSKFAPATLSHFIKNLIWCKNSDGYIKELRLQLPSRL